MSKVKDEYIAALEESADRLEEVVGPEEKGGQTLEEMKALDARLRDPLRQAKTKVRPSVEAIRGTANTLKSGAKWPVFRPEDAAKVFERVEWLRERVEYHSKDTAFQKAALDAMKPQIHVVERYAVKEGDTWRFREEDCDPLPEWNPPPDPNIRYKK